MLRFREHFELWTSILKNLIRTVGKARDEAMPTLRECKNTILWITWNWTSEIVRISIFTCETKIWHMLPCGYCTEHKISPSFTLFHFSISFSFILFYLLSPTILSVICCPFTFSVALSDSRYSSRSTFRFSSLLFLTFYFRNTFPAFLPLVFRNVYQYFFCPVVYRKLSGAISMTCTIKE